MLLTFIGLIFLQIGLVNAMEEAARPTQKAAKLQAMGKKITPAQLQEWDKYKKLKEESLIAIAAAQKAKEEPDKTKREMLYEAANLPKIEEELLVFGGTLHPDPKKGGSNELYDEVSKLYDQVSEAFTDFAWEFPPERQYIHPHDSYINISGLDKKKVLQALFQRAKVQRFKKLYAILPGADTLNDAEAQIILEKKGSKVGYIKGRSIKVDFSEDRIDIRNYDNDNGGPGTGFYAIEELKAGKQLYWRD